MLYGMAAAICFAIALSILGLFYIKKKQQEERKGFVVIAGTILFIYLFPSIALFVIGFVCLALFLSAIL